MRRLRGRAPIGTLCHLAAARSAKYRAMQIEQLQHDLDAARMRISEVTAKCAEEGVLRDRLADLQRQLDEMRQQNQMLSAHGSASAAKEDGLRNQIRELQEQLHTMERQKAMLAQQLAEADKLHETVRQLEQELLLAQRDKSELNSEISSLRGRESAMLEQIATLQRQLAAAQGEIEGMQKEKIMLVSKLDELNRLDELNKRQQRELEDANMQLAIANRNAATHAGNEESWREQLDRLQRQLQDAKAENAKTIDELERERAAARQASADSEVLRKQVS